MIISYKGRQYDVTRQQGDIGEYYFYIDGESALECIGKEQLEETLNSSEEIAWLANEIGKLNEGLERVTA